MVSASADEVKWSDPKYLTFTILPPFWQTWWFRITVGMILLLIIYFIYKWRLSAVLHKQKQLEKIVADRTAEVTHQKEIIEAKQKEVMDSIHYAKRIQTALLPTDKNIDKNFKKLKKL